MKFFSASEKQTLDFAKKFSKNLTGGQVLGLTGNLGAGKTVFTKGLALGIGIKKNITSPTFVLMKVYPVKSVRSSEKKSLDKPRIKFLVHIDACRIKSTHDLIAIGADEYFKRPDTITVIEWADKIKKILPKKAKFVKISINKTSRIINY
ncbi:tRNA (adenosine(37)-N6)-threonylcarbamoyltransferase complex ATPase subunit type 1 TsaE [Patescibacteria group bacterium]|nr:tRNA (adenosine(37)-N6)-threonylcarbamoyltransferase complex ATPase subunit type 1 TsaE [Patescibacteria group bacterium]MBU1663133.1 tRNA (adenosine(37)-N6)-threonylcarbamoyltransferase complex ATPase subunit type 1 TsaE [Patescibacteria group bacterium]MBU1933671.1 tRNA (adenosine(37)-N6)-threonylcarbamoyltransferase complex ATPase subunit type 1 TsaE [Patescibacteria group bacterium]MBU2008118.1 tRNA (adenosine(37)-N6)-threonylcarbamoyltransferase complex ATPase subunit type 1 TsaE [Patesc